MIDVIIPTIRPLKKLTETLVNPALHSRLPHVVHVVRDGASYAEAINITFPGLTQPFFLGADDINFGPDWERYAMDCMTDGVSVAGTNDLHHKGVLAGETATHYLVRRSYINEMGGTVDRSYPVLFQYHHNYTNTEFILTARARGKFVPCLKSIVERCHWTWDKAPFDPVYEKGTREFAADTAVFESRKHLWSPPARRRWDFSHYRGVT